LRAYGERAASLASGRLPWRPSAPIGAPSDRSLSEKAPAGWPFTRRPPVGSLWAGVAALADIPVSSATCHPQMIGCQVERLPFEPAIKKSRNRKSDSGFSPPRGFALRASASCLRTPGRLARWWAPSMAPVRAYRRALARFEPAIKKSRNRKSDSGFLPRAGSNHGPSG
jgi:hypothetical protein